jgi:hypothetical protein
VARPARQREVLTRHQIEGGGAGGRSAISVTRTPLGFPLNNRSRGLSLAVCPERTAWFGGAVGRAVEILSILGPRGERFHIRAGYRP